MTGPDLKTAGRRSESVKPSEAEVRAGLERVLTSADFASSGRMQAFLRFVVEEALAGRGARLKEFTIATEVFGRDETFDPQTNTIVRVEAGRLRRRLERYYLTEGQGDALRIDLPKGGYAPAFRVSSGAVQRAAADRQESGPDLSERPADAALDMPTGPSIAVLPFENLGGDPGQDFFGDGIAEEIINDLTRFPDLRVISRYSSFKFKGRHLDLRDIGRDLGVRYILEGSVRRAGDLLRITGQLVDTEDNSQLFSERYDRDLSAQNILEIQDDISDRIVSAVGQPYGVIARAGARRARSKASQDLDAYDAVLRFYEYWVDHSPAGHRAVRAGLERAVERDPNYASAWAALAETYLDEARFSFNPRTESDPLERALQAARRAVTLEPENSMAYQFLFSTHFHRGEIDEFRATGDRALALNPNHADMLADLGMMLCYVGQWERGVGLAEKAIALSPTHPGWFHVPKLYDHYRQGRFEEALAEARQLRMPAFYWTHMALAMCYGQLGRTEEAHAARERLLQVSPDVTDRLLERLAFWNMSKDLVELVLEGLGKAGLTLPEPADRGH